MTKYLTTLFCVCLAILANGQVVAKFSADTTKGCTPVTVNFQDNSTGSVSTYYWTFGNGNTSTKKNPSAIFYKPGTYTVTLKVTDASGNSHTETKTKYIEVFEIPKANFDPLKKEGCVELDVTFSNKSVKGTGAIDQVTWDFGDGNTLISKTGFHRYKHAGTYSVSMLVIDENKCEHKIKKDDIITVWPRPDVDFEADETFSCIPPLKASFKNLTKNKAAGDKFEWDFGDGNKSTKENPTHEYTKNGSYTVTLTVTNKFGCKSTRTYPSYININPIKVDFDISDIDGCIPMDVSFTNTSVPQASGFSYYWDFGNGKTSQTRNGSTTYTKAGSYKVSLTVSKNGKCAQTQTYDNVVKVKESPVPKIGVNDSITCLVPFNLKVEDLGTGGLRWSWLLNDVPMLNQKSGTIPINAEGSYVLKLVSKNFEGCESDTLQKLIQIRPIDVTATPDTAGCVPLPVNFINTTALDPNDVASQVWTFGDGQSKTITGGTPTTASHTYTKDGIYSVTLEVTTKEGCKGSTDLEIKVGKKRQPKISEGPDTLCNSQIAFIKNLTDMVYRDSVDTMIWSLNYTYPTPRDTGFGNPPGGNTWDFGFETRDMDTGYYDVRLILGDRGCFDTAVMGKRLFILPPVARISPLHDTCANDIMILANVSKYFDSIEWQINKSLLYDSIIRVGTDTAHSALLRAYNFTSKCIDSVSFRYRPKPSFSGQINLSGELCAPSMLTMSGKADAPYLAYQWVINGSDTFDTRFLSIPAKLPGKYTIKYMVTDTSATGGCFKTDTATLDVTGPTVDGKIDGTADCGPVNVTLTSNSDPKDFKLLFWTVGSDTFPVTAKGDKVIELYKPGPDDGKWPITLVGIDSNGCSGTEEFEFEVYGTKNAELKISRFKDCSGRQFIFAPRFNDPVDDSNWEYEWDLGDGNSSTLKVVNHKFGSAGVYVVRLYMKDENGCITRLQDTVDINNEVLQAKFFADSLIKDCPPLHVQFEDRSTLNGLRSIVAWEWKFGDGTTSKERYPSKLYLEAGTFDVSLKVTDEWGCQDSFTYPGFILVNGPIGDYVFDKKEGCVPLEVTFTGDTSNCTEFTWDFGDGNIHKNQLKVTHTYQDTGRFIPLLTLKDTFGCKYTHPPIDTIYVYPNPIPDFQVVGPCPGIPSSFLNLSWPPGYKTNCSWDFGDGTTSSDCKPIHTYDKGGTYKVKLSVTTPHGCTGDTVKDVVIKRIEADFTTENNEVCVGNTIKIKDRSISDTTLIGWEWLFDDGTKYSGPEVIRIFDKIGPVGVRLVIHDAIGCTDTLESVELLKVGDTIPPVPTDLLRVSVEDDFSYLIDYKRSTIPDFKSYLLFHDDGLYKEVYDVDQTRIVVPNVNTLHNVYCSKVAVRNACGLVSDTLLSYPDCTVEVSAQGELNQSRINWNGYEGWNDVETYYIYREDIDTNGKFFLLDSVDGQTLEYVDTNILCYATHTYRILAKERSGNDQVSWSDTCKATPIYVNSLPPNEVVRATVQHDEYVRLEWAATPYSKMPIDRYILEKSIDQGVNYRVMSTVNADEFAMDDHLVEVDSQSYVYRVKAVDVCDDESPYSNIGKTILLHADTGLYQRPVLTWSYYEDWPIGVDKYEVQRKEPDGSFYSLGYTNSGDDTLFYDMETKLNLRPHFCYRVIGHKFYEDSDTGQIVSISNEDCISVHSWLHVPNAFSPNDDGLNDKFVTPGWYIKEYKIQIYNRWGEKLFESETLYDSWDGTYNGELVENEAYVYIIESIGIDNIKRNYKGTVTVLK
jgi:gliding motility-associated-like protein